MRERLLAGDSDDQIIDYVTERYGEYVLLNPTTRGANWLLWAAGPGLLVIGISVGVVFIRRRSRASPEGENALTEEERARLDEILRR